MCGIAGQIGAPVEESTIRALHRCMAGRGPDQNGYWSDAACTLVHARLAVIDLKGGIQPMSLGNKAIVYNGEIYNTSEVRAALAACGRTFLGHSDTEVVLHAYDEWGEDCLQRLNGIFAFAVWDGQRLFAARDRMGVKPFFYSESGGQFCFASEIKGVLAFPHMNAELDLNGICEVMLLGPGRTPGCGVFRGICELPPAHCGYYEPGRGFSFKRYWSIQERRHTESFEETAEHVRELVTDSIERQLVADVPVCTFLSGGLDSSLISSVAARRARANGKKLSTVSVTYKENEKYFQAGHFQPNSDESYIRLMSRYLDSDHHLIEIDTPELADALYDAVDARDLPGMADVDSSLLLFCREIKKIGTVALSGECADEIFGGYPWYRDKDIRMTDGFPWAQSTVYRAAFLKEELARSINAEAYVYQKYRDTIDFVEKPVYLSETDRRMREMTRLNLDWFMQTLLETLDAQKSDRNFVGHSQKLHIKSVDIYQWSRYNVRYQTIGSGRCIMKEQEIGFQIRMLSNMLSRYLWNHGHGREMENITGSNGWILGYLACNQDRDVFQRDLEELFSIRRSTASKSITLMEKKGLIRRERVDCDARLRKLVLTEKGRQIHYIMVNDIKMAEKQLTAGLTEEEKTALLQIIEKMKHNIQEDSEKKGGVAI